MNEVSLFMGGPNWRPPFTCSFDDFAFIVPTPSAYTLFGTGCLSSNGVPTINPPANLPSIGTNFDITVTSLPITSAVFGLIGVSNTQLGNGTPLPLDLGVIGMRGCRLLVSNDVLQFVGNRPTPDTALWRLTIPNLANLLGATFHQQVLVTDPGANSLGVVVSNGGTGTIGGC